MHARSSTLPHRDLPVVLIIRDGWGQNPHPEQDAFNAIKLAHTPVDDRLMREWPHTLVITSGEDVGLPPGTMGNSEVGHQNIGAGRIVDQELMRITRAIRTGASPRHVPARVVQVADIPRTKSGKITELAVREVVHGRQVKNQDALATPEALEHFRDLAELRA